MSKSKSSKSWLKEHFDDAWVQRSKADGYRSRASYKLLEIQKSDRLIKPGMTIVDLGSAPGGWSQVAAQLAGVKGTVIASDILAMDAVNGVVFVQGDFTEEDCFKEILSQIPSGEGVDLVISDMAPNLSGAKAVDQPAMMYLAELAIDLTCQVMKPEGVFIAKLFQGEGFDQFVRHVRTVFNSVSIKKPDASRAKSREVYMVAKGLKAN